VEEERVQEVKREWSIRTRDSIPRRRLKGLSESRGSRAIFAGRMLEHRRDRDIGMIERSTSPETVVSRLYASYRREACSPRSIDRELIKQGP